MAFVIRQRSARNAYVGEGTFPVSRKDARKYRTMAEAERSIASAARRFGVEQSDLRAMREPTSGIHKDGSRKRKTTPEPPDITDGERVSLWVTHTSKGAYDRDFLENSHVAISYGYGLSLAEVGSKEALKEQQGSGAEVLWRFYSELKEGDLVVVPFKDAGASFRDARVSVGEVTGPYEFRGDTDPYHIRPLRWIAHGIPASEFDDDLYNSMTIEPAFHRIAVTGAEGRVRRLAWSGVDAYIKRAQPYINSGQLDDDEMDYKASIIAGLGRAREALNAGDNEWPSLIRAALGVPGSPLNWRSGASLYDWFASDPKDAAAAMQAFWAEDGTPVGERIRAFVDRIPESDQFRKSQAGTTLRSVSALLMALGPEYPPFAKSSFDSAYELSRYPEAPRGADQGELYEHALGFLNLLVRRTAELGFQRPADVLEAQSIVWMMRGEVVGPGDLEALAAELFLDTGFLREVERLLDDKRQVIFQGPPGTGKTYVARKLAECLAGSRDRVRLVQFHPSYAYEDFVQGYRPTVDAEGRASFELRGGPLVQLAEQARGDRERGLETRHFLVIDEINRGNLAKVFGELYFLLEYRDEPMQLQYSDDAFELPDNLYIIGTMNTADRSIALVDLALRRRFHFVEFHPDKPPVQHLLGRWLDDNAQEMGWVANVVKRANERLENREAAIGPSYFMQDDLTEEKVRLIWEHNVLPYIEEQLYGQHDRLTEFALDRLRRELSGAGDEESEPVTGEQADEAGSGDADA